MNIVSFDWQSGLLGGAIIGFAAVLMMLTLGRIAGISGLLAQSLSGRFTLSLPRAFVAGLVFSGIVVHYFIRPIPLSVEADPMTLVVAGLLVGFGTRLGSGCTSGHGVCGISRFSWRSIASTCLFMAVAVATVFVMKHVIGGLVYGG